MSTESGRPVVVGVDYTTGSDTALQQAVREARSRDTSLMLVHAFGPPFPFPDSTPFVGTTAVPGYPGLLETVSLRLDRMRDVVQAAHPDLQVGCAVDPGPPGAVLVERSRSAGLVVVGARGGGRFAGVLLGSVAAQVAAHAHCPVLVVHPPRPGSPAAAAGPVVAGVDGSVHSQDVLAQAFAAAAARGVALTVVHVWWVPEGSGLGEQTPWSDDLDASGPQMRAGSERVLAEALAGWAEKYPQVPVESVLRHGFDPAWEICEQADELGAGLVVIGSRGRGGFPGLLFGSVGRSLAERVGRPVLVVHPAHS